MTIVDTHSHIYLGEFENDRPAMLERAQAEGISRILMPAIDSTTHSAMIEMEKKSPESYISMMGLHPCSVKENFRDELKIARDYFDQRKFIAVGEIGLDFYWDKAFVSDQYIAFHEQIEWALHFDIPIVIHSRVAIDECTEVVREHQNGKLKGVFHNFSGTIDQAQKIIKLGFYLGIGGVVTYKNSGMDKVMLDISLDDIVLETDAPYLTPVPFRGKRNEPSYLKYVVEKLMEIKKVTKEDIAEVTTANAKKLFGL